MKNIIFLFLLSLYFQSALAQVQIAEVAKLPEEVANNAVCEGFIDGVPYVYSFGGIDASKKYSGIHLRSYRYNTQTKESVRIPDLPDSRGKIAAAASRINEIIYISGGYHVYKDGSEISSKKMHRYDIKNNVYLTDGEDIPVPIDDHVQAVWNNQLIYIITGWSHTENIPNVQIYDPAKDRWLAGTSTPNKASYKSFGASGTIINNTIYYFGGATSVKGFKIQNQLRIGQINPNNPTEIDWSISTPDPTINGYRMAATSIKNEVYWMGGSNNTYNYNGIAYDGSGGVPTANRILSTKVDNLQWKSISTKEIPMDLRGIANLKDGTKYLMGGMIGEQKVTNKIYKIEIINK